MRQANKRNALLATIPTLMTLGKARCAVAEDAAKPVTGGPGPARDFDFFLGAWHVEHRRLKKRLVPGIGRFANGVGTFLSDDTFDGKPVTVCGVFSPIMPNLVQWEHAYSPDGGKTWETNWMMRYPRTA